MMLFYMGAIKYGIQILQTDLTLFFLENMTSEQEKMLHMLPVSVNQILMNRKAVHLSVLLKILMLFQCVRKVQQSGFNRLSVNQLRWFWILHC